MAKPQMRRKDKRAAHLKRKAAHRRTSKPETAIVKAQVVTPVVVEAGRRRELTGAEIQLIQNTVAKGTTPEQFSTFLWFCRKHEFDPLAKEVYCILFNVQKHHQDEKGIWCPGKEMVIVTGIGGMRGKAARDHRDEYGSTDEPVYTFSGLKTPAGKSIPDTCSVSVWKKGAQRPTTATLYWEEFAPRDLTDSRFEFWNKSPKNQLAKCAEAQALRKAYPDLTNIYVTEEIARRMSEETPGGRRIVDAPVGPSHDRAIEAEVERQQRGELPSVGAAGVAAAGGGARAASDRAGTAAPSYPPTAATAQTGKSPQVGQEPANKPLGIVTIDYTDEAWPIVRGDLGAILDNLHEALPAPMMDWGKDSWWHVQPRAIETLKAVLEKLHYQCQEVFPSSAATPAGRPCPPAGPPTAQGKERKAPTPSAPAVELPPPGEPGWVTGIIEKAEGRGKGYEKNSDKKTRVSINLKVGKATFSMSTFDTALFPPLLAGKGKEAVLVIQRRQKGDETYNNIIGLKRIGTTEYDPEDGKTPIVQNSTREAGARTLF